MAYDLIVPTYPIAIPNFPLVSSSGWEGQTLDGGYYAYNTSGISTGTLYNIANPNDTGIKLDHVLANSGKYGYFEPTNQKAPILVANNEIYSFYNGQMWVFNMQGKTIRVSPQIPSSVPNLESSSLLLFGRFGGVLQKPDGKIIFLATYPSPTIYTTATPGYLKNYHYCVEYSFSNFQIERQYVVYLKDKSFYVSNYGTNNFSYYYINTGKRAYTVPNFAGTVTAPLISGDSYVEFRGQQTTNFSRLAEDYQDNYFFANRFYTSWGSALANTNMDRNIQAKNISSYDSLRLISYAPDSRYWQLVNNATSDPYLYVKGINISLLIPKTFYDPVRNQNVSIPSGTTAFKAYNNNSQYGYFYRGSSGNYLFVPFIGKVNYTFPITNYSLGKEFK